MTKRCLGLGFAFITAAMAASCTSAGDGSGGGATTGIGGGTSVGGGASTATGAGGQAPCVIDEVEACYDGPTATRYVGLCADGTRTCAPNGIFGTCMGQILPELADDCTATGDEDCDGVGCSERVWSVTYDTELDSTAHAIGFGPGGVAYMAGTFHGDLWFDVEGFLGNSNPAMYVTQIQANGTSGWAAWDTAGTEEFPFDLAVADDGGVVYAGGFRGNLDTGTPSQGEEDVFVTRRDSAGDRLWLQTFGDAAPFQRATQVAIDPDGHVIVVGRFTGNLDFGGGATVSHSTTDVDVFVAKLNGSTGIGMWARSYGDPAIDDSSPVLTLGPAGEVMLAGGFSGTIMPAGAGMSISSPTDLDVYAAKLSALGAPVWAKRFGGAGDQRATAVEVDLAGNVLLAGTMYGTMDLGTTLVVPDATADAFVGKLSSAGDALAGRRFDDVGDTSVTAAGVDAQGNLTITGTTTDSVDFGGGVLSDAQGDTAPFLAKVDTGLSHRWSKVFQVSGSFTPNALAIDSAGVGTVAIAGLLDGTVVFDGSIVTSDASATAAMAAAAFQP